MLIFVVGCGKSQSIGSATVQKMLPGNLCLVKCCGCSISRQAIYAQEGDFEVMIELVSSDIVCVVRLDLLQIDMEMSFKLMGL